MGGEKLMWTQKDAQPAPSLFLGCKPPYSGQPAQHNFFRTCFFLFSSWCLRPSSPQAVISMTHKPSILALNFTHQNKDEKNFVDTVVLLGVLTGHKLATGALSSGAGPVWGTLFWNWGWPRLQGPRAGWQW